MAEVIQFPCPTCGTALRLPLAMAGRQGPCPHCSREIIAPDPYRGIGAREAPPLWHPVELEPTRPFVESPPVVALQPVATGPRTDIWENPPAEHPSVQHSQLPVGIPVPPPAPYPFSGQEQPVVTPPPAAVEREEKEVVPRLIPEPPVCQKPQRTILVLSCLLTASVALAWGFAWGVHWAQHAMRPAEGGPLVLPIASPDQTPTEKTVLPAEVSKPTLPESVEKPEPAKSEPPVLVKPKVEEPEPEPAPKIPEDKVKSEKVSAAAQASLQAFLEAPDWASRNAHVLFPEKMREAMEAYSHSAPDGPTAYKAISVKQSQIDEKTGLTLFVFMVETDRFPQGIPVAVKETTTGWLVDWRTFVEFRDGLFQKFNDGPVDQTGYFHLVVTKPTAERAAITENATYSSFMLQAPLEEKARMAFARKNSDAYQEIQAQIAAGGSFAPVLEVRKRKTPEGQPYLEILKVIAADWLPREEN